MNLVAEHGQGLGTRTHKAHALRRAARGEVAVLAQKAVARVECVAVRCLGGREYGVDVEVRARTLSG